MNFLPIVLQGLSLVPTIVGGVENIFGGRPGIEKRNAAVSFLEAAMSMSDAVMSRHIVDEAKFRAGLGEIIDGVVACLNSSAWAKESTPVKPSL